MNLQFTDQRFLIGLLRKNRVPDILLVMYTKWPRSLVQFYRAILIQKLTKNSSDIQCITGEMEHARQLEP